MQDFDAVAEVAKLRARKKITRKKVHRRSQLDEFHGELIALKINGATPTDLRTWLRQKNIKVHLTTVIRWLDNRG